VLDFVSEGKGVPHENLLLCNLSLCLVLTLVAAAGASTLATTVAIVFKALTVEFEAPRVGAVAGLHFVFALLWLSKRIGCLVGFHAI
jgi:hypothetical protein